MSQQPKWVPATDLAFFDVIRFRQMIRDRSKKTPTKYRQIEGRIVYVYISLRQVVLATGGGPLRRAITTIEKGEPQRLEYADRQPLIALALPKRRKGATGSSGQRNSSIAGNAVVQATRVLFLSSVPQKANPVKTRH